MTPGDDRRELTIRLPKMPKLPGRARRPKLPKGRKKFLALIPVVAAVAFAGWWFGIRDTGPTKAEIEAKEKAEQEAAALAEAQAEQATCQSQVGALIAKERELESLLNGVGLAFDEYSDKVGEVSVAYGTIPIDDLSAQCLTRVGIHSEKAMNNWVEAGDTWNDCVTDLYCENDSIDPELQADWLIASDELRKASEGMEELGQP